SVYAQAYGPPSIEAGYEVKVNLDPATAEAALPGLVAGVSLKPRSVIYYLISPATPLGDDTIVRARRDSKNKTDIDVKLRGIPEVLAWMITGGPKGLEGVECETDIGFAPDEGNLSCDIKVETAGDTSPLDGDSVRARLTTDQVSLLEIGVHQPAQRISLDACPAVS